MDINLLQQTLVQLAGEAANPELTTNSPNLPDTWKTLTTQLVSAPTVGNIQILLAYGNVGSDVIACMALGLPWSNLLGEYHFGFSPQNKQMLPTSVMGDPQGNSTILSLYALAYNYLRSHVWDSLSYLTNPGVTGKPLYLTGMGLGGPLAQIVALDFRPGQKGPADQNIPFNSQPPSYAFSTGNIGTKAFQSLYNQRVSNTYLVTVGSTTLPVDLFPSEPSGSALDFAPLGTSAPVTAPVPQPYFTPWEVRDSIFYLTALGGKPQTFTPSPTSIPSPPAGFSQALAFSLGKMTAMIYQQAMQPDTTGFPDTTSYILVDTINYGGSLIAGVFTNPNCVVIAFRGSITFEEFLSWEAATSTASTPYGQMVVTGANNVYYQDPNNSGTTLADQVIAQVTTYSDKKLYLTGHGFGGVLANMAAADLTFKKTNPSPIKGIYTFGANYWAGTAFSANFNGKLGAVSYQVLRPQDKIATALSNLPLFNPVGNIVVLNGTLNVARDTSHSLDAYLSLLDPSRVI
ncbi:hypothetical protein MM239_14750 [Belliella sp. DSM 111904]|uniref:Fungal lipase-type domain-containing protein n=1 Tax=Belliella filtrata TaxID=2923435 RepID=A0ABS9V380_9BACT|nr:hypothetical protein [Belliella filtrata]MCH7410664.1 hypothetical protein [Belliella filtrata]